LLSWPAPALALPSVSPRTSAPGRISSAVPNTSASAPATTPFLSAPVPLVLSRSQTPNLPRSSAQHSPGSFAARTSASPAFPFQTSSVTSRDQKSTKAPQSSGYVAHKSLRSPAPDRSNSPASSLYILRRLARRQSPPRCQSSLL